MADGGAEQLAALSPSRPSLIDQHPRTALISLSSRCMTSSPLFQLPCRALDLGLREDAQELVERGVETLLALEPRVAATEGEAGGSGERVK